MAKPTMKLIRINKKPKTTRKTTKVAKEIKSSTKTRSRRNKTEAQPVQSAQPPEPIAESTIQSVNDNKENDSRFHFDNVPLFCDSRISQNYQIVQLDANIEPMTATASQQNILKVNSNITNNVSKITIVRLPKKN